MGNRKAREWSRQQGHQASWDRLGSEPWRPESDVRAFGSGTPRIQIIRLPSFEQPCFWEVCERESEWVLYRASVIGDWFPVNVRGYEQVDFPMERLKHYFNCFLSLSVPMAPHRHNADGLDGTMTQLALFGGFSSQVRFQWWSDHPPGWTPLVQVTDEMLAAFGRAVAGD